jgi:predicted ATPase/tetratricopeptide (TPR) repeat protein
MARRPVPRTNLPVERGAFVGRERALLAIGKALGDGPAVVVLVGPAGIGKTRLALRAAARELPRFGQEGGVWLVECLGAEDGDGLIRLIGLMLGLLPDASAPPDIERARIAAVLCERGPALVVVDGVDEVRDAPAVLASFSILCPGVRFLVTQREPVPPTSGLVAFTVGPLSLKRERRPDDVSEASSLFIERANEARGSHARHADASELAAIDAITRHLDGVPQAIEVAAARCRVLTPGELLERLPRHAPGASSGRRSALAGVVAWSFDLLQPWERATLAQAVIFHGGFTLEAAREVIDLSEIEGAPSVAVAVESLVEKALLKAMVGGDDAPVRYTHPTAVRELIVQVKPQRRQAEPVRTSTLELLPGARSGEGAVPEVPRLELFTTRESLVRRHATWVLNRCGTLRENVDGHGGLLARHELEAEQDNLLAVVRRALADDTPTLTGLTQALMALVALEPVMTTRGPHDLFARLLDRTVDRAGPLGVSPGLVARVLELRARVRRARGQLAASKEDLSAALVQARRARDRLLEARALANLGTHAIAVADLDAARSAYDEAIAILREQKDARIEARCIGFYGLLEEELGHLDVARTLYGQAIATHQRLGDRRYEGIHETQLARVHLGLGALDDARELLRRSLVIHRELHNRRQEALALMLKGDLSLVVGDRDDASAVWSAAAVIAREVGDPGLLALVHGRLAAAGRAFGKDVRAHDVVVDAALQRLDDAAARDAVAVLRGTSSSSKATLVLAAERVRQALEVR